MSGDRGLQTSAASWEKSGLKHPVLRMRDVTLGCLMLNPVNPTGQNLSGEIARFRVMEARTLRLATVEPISTMSAAQEDKAVDNGFHK